MEFIENAKHWRSASDNIQNTIFFLVDTSKIFGDILLNKKKTAMKVIKKAIQKLHNAGLVHGDLRNTNILVSGKCVIVALE